MIYQTTQSIRQLTLFINNQFDDIEWVIKVYNLIQFNLIPAHITLCREDEITSLESIKNNLLRLHSLGPLSIYFDPVKRFEDGKGCIIPGAKFNPYFQKDKSGFCLQKYAFLKFAFDKSSIHNG